MEKTGARINVPPPSVPKDEIIVTGEKEGVLQCKKAIMSIFEEKVGYSLACNYDYYEFSLLAFMAVMGF